MHHVEHISIYINRVPGDVYAFASNPENLPRWAAGLARSEVKREAGAWVAHAPFGLLMMRNCGAICREKRNKMSNCKTPRLESRGVQWAGPGAAIR